MHVYSGNKCHRFPKICTAICTGNCVIWVEIPMLRAPHHLTKGEKQPSRRKRYCVIWSAALWPSSHPLASLWLSSHPLAGCLPVKTGLVGICTHNHLHYCIWHLRSTVYCQYTVSILAGWEDSNWHRLGILFVHVHIQVASFPGSSCHKPGNEATHKHTKRHRHRQTQTRTDTDTHKSVFVGSLRHLPFVVRNAGGRGRVWTARILSTLYRFLPLLFSSSSSFIHLPTFSASGIMMVDSAILWDTLRNVGGMFVYRTTQNDSSLVRHESTKHGRRWPKKSMGCTSIFSKLETRLKPMTGEPGNEANSNPQQELIKHYKYCILHWVSWLTRSCMCGQTSRIFHPTSAPANNREGRTAMQRDNS